MAKDMLDQVREALDGVIDFDGQRRAEVVATIFLAVSGLITFNVGFLSEDIKLAVKVGLGLTFLTALLTVPPWPFWRVNPVKWLPAGSDGAPTMVKPST